MSSAPLEKSERRKRRRELFTLVIVLLAVVALSNVALGLSKASSTLPFINSLFFFGIINLNLILLAVLVFLIYRNLLKLFLERRSGLLGSKLKTKLVAAFLSLSIVPTVVLFLISALYINSTFDKWFSVQVGNTLQASLEITNAYYKDHQKSAHHFAEKIRSEMEKKGRLDSFETLIGGNLNRELKKFRHDFSLAAVELYTHPLDPSELVAEDGLAEDIFPRLPIESVEKVLKGETVFLVQHVGSGDVLRSIIPLTMASDKQEVIGALSVNHFVPVSLVTKATKVSTTFEDYRKVNPLKYPIKSIYFSILILITLLIIFVAIWVGLYMAREMTVPLEHLEKAVNEVGSGNFDVEITNTGNDEIANVLRSFNRMTVDIKEHRDRLETTNLELDEKRRYVEAILSNVSAGVCSIDRDFVVTTVNKSAATLLGLDSDIWIGKTIEKVFVGDLSQLDSAIREVVDTDQKDTVFKYLNLISVDGHPVSILVSMTPLYGVSSEFQGMVMVLDDVTHLIKAQRETAWREVARRIAHEIKNPLTPIKLSAQRLQKKFLNNAKDEEDRCVFKECTDTIIRQVDELKEMVNEFSQYARFPAANPLPNDLNGAIAEVITLYQQAHKRIEFQLEYEKDLPVFSFDREQIKRVLINLLDNAVAVIKEKAGGRISVRTRLEPSLGTVTIEVLDNGPGISNQIMPLLFEPYFSTRKEGTGLGLAIAKRIISDHDGYIRANPQIDVKEGGACFTIELPLSRVGEVVHES